MKNRKPAEGKPSVGILKRMLPYALQFKGLLAMGFIALIASAGLNLVLPQAVRFLVDQGFNGSDPSALTTAALVTFGVAVLMGVIMALRTLLLQAVGINVVRKIRKDVFSRLMKQGLAFFDKMRTGELISRLNNDVGTLHMAISRALPLVVLYAVVILGTLVMMFITSWKLALATLVLIPIVLVSISIMGRYMNKYSKRKQDQLAALSICVDENVGGVKTVQSFNQAEAANDQFGEGADNVAKANWKMTIANALYSSFSTVLMFAFIAFSLWLGGRFMLSGELSGGQFAAFMMYAYLALQSAEVISGCVSDLYRAAGASERLFEILDEELTMDEAETPTPLPAAKGGRDVVFKDVRFAYPSRADREVLHGLNLTIPAGKTFAIVGPSGAGKSTLFNLLLRHYDVTDGGISLDGINVRQTALSDLRATVAIVSQEPSMFSTSILENIRFGRPDATEDEVIAAAKAANAHDFISQLADGYDTYVGEKGVQMSGGQKQRIAIARAFLCDPDVLLLDEATSNLDAQSEHAIKQALDSLKKGRTTIIVAHRLATVVGADQIAVLEGGLVSDVGTHDELLQTSGLYQSIMRLQMLKN